MPLKVEILKNGKWKEIGKLKETDLPGSFSNNLPDGKREIYVFECLGNYSAIYRSKAGVDVEFENFRSVYSLDLELVKKLQKKESSKLK